MAILLTADEEVGCVGAKFLARKKVLRARHMVIGEPTGLRPVSRRKGICAGGNRRAGKEAHSAFPAQGRSAIFDAARVVMALERVAKKLEATEESRVRSAVYDAERRADSGRDGEEYCGGRVPDYGRVAAGSGSGGRLGGGVDSRGAGGIEGNRCEAGGEEDGSGVRSVGYEGVWSTLVESLTGRRRDHGFVWDGGRAFERDDGGGDRVRAGGYDGGA